jgi:hypothetical protein
MKSDNPIEKQQAKARKNLLILHNGIKSEWNFGSIRTWHSLYKRLGFEEQYINKQTDGPLSFEELKKYLQLQTDEQEQRFKEGVNGEIKTEKECNNTSSKAEYVLPNLHEYVLPSLPVETEHNDSKKVIEISATVTKDEPDSNKSDEAGLNNSNDYGLVNNPNWKAFHYWFQKKAIKEALDKILGFDTSLCEGKWEKLVELWNDPTIPKKPKRGILILSGTGTGKTFIVSAIVRILWDLEYHTTRTFSHIPYLWITKNTVVEQASRVLKNFYCLNPVNDVEVINIEKLRSSSGQLWLQEEVVVENGEARSIWKWKPVINPCVIFFDESQGAKNTSSTQSKIICAYNDLKRNAILVSVSATPFTRVAEAKSFAVSTRRPLDHLGFPSGTVLTNDTWPTYAAMIASPASPNGYSQAAIERLMKDLENYIVRVRGVRSQFNAINRVKVIQFETKEKAQFYFSAWERFLKEKAKMEEAKEQGLDPGNYMFVILLKFAMAAELAHADHFAADMYEKVQKGYAACAAVKFKGTIIEIVKILNEKYGVSRDKISLIWGGGQTQLTKKQKDKQKIEEMDEKFKAMGLSAEEMLGDMGLEDVEDREIQKLPAHLRLEAQSMDERQIEIDRFQRGDSLYCLYTFKSGGVGLSLHHCDELTEFKCRRKESGYAVEEDIPKVPVRPRWNHVMLTYNAIELVQGVGRLPRLTSLSDTNQDIYAYAGTIEVDIGNIVSQKLRCLSSVVKQRESWQDVIMKGNNSSERAQKVKELIATTEGVKDENSTMIDESEEEE